MSAEKRKTKRLWRAAPSETGTVSCGQCEGEFLGGRYVRWEESSWTAYEGGSLTASERWERGLWGGQTLTEANWGKLNRLEMRTEKFSNTEDFLCAQGRALNTQYPESSKEMRAAPHCTKHPAPRIFQGDEYITIFFYFTIKKNRDQDQFVEIK